MSESSTLRWGVVAFAVAGLAAAGREARGVSAHGAPGRYNEPIVLTGADLEAFEGAPKAQLWAYAFDHGNWERIPLQMDERNSRGRVVTAEDGLLDADDEVVMTSELLGARRGESDWPPGIGREHAAGEVRVTDPRDADWEGFAYIFWSPTGPENALPPAVTWDEATSELRSAAYTLGFADFGRDGFSGLKTLRLFSGAGDILDRLKIRVGVTIVGMSTTYTEESDLIDLPVPEPVSSGPVRLVLDASGDMAAYARRVSLGSGLGDFDPSFPGLVTVNSALVALDFLPAAGPGTYRDAGVPAGVPVDGVQDSVPSAWSPWRQVDLLDGRVVSLSARAAVQNHYTDGEFPGDTGDDTAFGQNGVSATDIDALLEARFPGDLVMLAQGQDIDGETLFEQSQFPLETEVTFGAVPTPTGDTPTPTETGGDTPTPTETEPVTATPTNGAVTPSSTPTDTDAPHHHVYLPRCLTAR
jgi:hypothetical protein